MNQQKNESAEKKSNARQVALEIITDVTKNKSYLNLELKKRLNSKMSVTDRRFVTALVSTALENLYRIDYILDQYVTAKRVHTVIRNILRLGVCQLLFFESVPESAAVNESVKLARENGKRQLTGFVNATLRNIAGQMGQIQYPDPADDSMVYLHVMYSYPKWLCEKYVREYGRAFAEEMLSYHANPALTCVRVNQIKKSDLTLEADPGMYCEDAFYLKNAVDIEHMPAFFNGYIAVQGEASMLCVRAAGIHAQDAVLDVCAAPGGKSCYTAQMAAQGSVTAIDLHPHRVELIEQMATRLGAANITAFCADASQSNAEWNECYDVVLVDAPCTALGLLYRKPDIKLSKEEEDIVQLVQVQKAILDTCANYVKPGGVILYSTCTIDRCENDDVVDWFLEKHSEFREDDLKNELPEALMSRAQGGRLQLFPHIDHVDGFFMARMRKNG